MGFRGSLGGKESTYNEGDWGSIPGLGRSPGEGNGHPLQWSGLENSMERGVWQAWQSMGRKESDMTEWLSLHFTHTHTHTHTHICIYTHGLHHCNVLHYLYANDNIQHCLILTETGNMTLVLIMFSWEAEEEIQWVDKFFGTKWDASHDFFLWWEWCFTPNPV